MTDEKQSDKKRKQLTWRDFVAFQFRTALVETVPLYLSMALSLANTAIVWPLRGTASNSLTAAIFALLGFSLVSSYVRFAAAKRRALEMRVDLLEKFLTHSMTIGGVVRMSA